ncbi:hypothetical protein [Dyella sp. RRB7]|uniref:hypothetical protein n=1 Tax=Dyella sp. RRB7 TaxID=2919502 RepID=UPI001FA985A4|nr:hypothetical protein [Dyella sp. RRB7]
MYAYVGGNPLSRTDPLGLWAFSVQAYLGAGGGVNVSWANGTLEITGQIGVGIGAGLSWDPNGSPSPHAKECGSGLIARTTFNASAGLGFGPLSTGASYVNAGENVFDPSPKSDVMDWGTGGYSSLSLTPIGVDNTPTTSGFGFRYGVSLSAEAGSYSNW